jgi:hypothetical protein
MSQYKQTEALLEARFMSEAANEMNSNLFDRVAVMSRVTRVSVSLKFIVGATAFGAAQSNPQLQTYFKETGGLSQEQISAIQSGQPVARH